MGGGRGARLRMPYRGRKLPLGNMLGGGWEIGVGWTSGGCELEAEEVGLAVWTVGVMRGFGAGEGCD